MAQLEWDPQVHMGLMLKACTTWDRQAESGQDFQKPSEEHLQELAQNRPAQQRLAIPLEPVRAAAAGDLQPLQDWWWLEKQMGGGWRNLPGDPGEAWLTICFVAAQNGLVHLLRSLLLDRMGSGNSDPEDSEPELSDAEVGICEGSDFSGGDSNLCDSDAAGLLVYELSQAAAKAGHEGLVTLVGLAAYLEEFCDWIFPKEFVWTKELCMVAGEAGNLQTLIWLRRQSCPCPWNAPACAAEITGCPAWAELQTCPGIPDSCLEDSAALWTLAAYARDSAVMQKLMAAGATCAFESATCEALFAGGDTAILSWLLCDYGQRDAMAYGPIIAEWIETAVRHSYLAPVQWLREQQGASLFWEWPGLYAKAGSFEASELLRSPAFSCPCTADDYAAAVSRGSEEDSRQLWRLGKRLEGEALKAALAAAAASALVEVQMLHRTSAHIHNDGQWTSSVCEAAARTGNLPLMQWLWGKVPHSFWDEACILATKTEALQWLVQQEPCCLFEQWLPASQWQNPIGSTSGSRGWELLALHRRLPSPGLLAAIPKEAYACRQAAATGNVELMAWLRANGTPWDARACNLAVANGHTPMLKFLRSQTPPCDWSSHTSKLAADGDRWETLLWLLSQDPPCPFPTRLERASNRCLALLIQWGCPLPSPAAKAQAAQLGPLPVSLLLGLTRWHRGDPGSVMQRGRCGSAPQADLLAHLASLPEGVILHICSLAGLCSPTNPVRKLQ